MRLRTEISKFANVPGVTSSFAKCLTGVYQTHQQNPDASADWIIQSSGLGYLPLDVELPWQMIQQEASQALPHMIENPKGDHDSQGWFNFGIYTRGAEDVGDYGRPVIEHNDTWTEQALKYMPNTVKYLQTQWPHEQFYKIRLLGLEPHGIIGLHTDDCEGLQNINIAIDQPHGCNFYLEHSGVVPFVNGQAFMIDVGRRHAVINKSDHYRIHLIIYQKHSTEFENLVVRSYNKYCQQI